MILSKSIWLDLIEDKNVVNNSKFILRWVNSFNFFNPSAKLFIHYSSVGKIDLIWINSNKVL
jgi:hypothetical protein